jgi:predicted nucleic acid-binding protein
MLVVDANILIRAVLGRRVNALLQSYAGRVDFLAPDSAYREARERIPGILSRRGGDLQPATEHLESLTRVVQPVELEGYSALEETARARLKGRDEKDWPILALALTNNFPIWTEDADFFGTGVATWTTNRVEIFLREASEMTDEATSTP